MQDCKYLFPFLVSHITVIVLILLVFSIGRLGNNFHCTSLLKVADMLMVNHFLV